MKFTLIAYTHEIEGAYLDQAVLRFSNDASPQATVPLVNLHPQILPALRGHLTGNSTKPLHYMITGFTNQLAAGAVDIEIIVQRIAPSSAQQKLFIAYGMDRELRDALAVAVEVPA